MLLHGRRRRRLGGLLADPGAAAAGDTVDEAEKPILELGGEVGHGGGGGASRSEQSAPARCYSLVNLNHAGSCSA